jgi:hypothetical protein
MCDILPLPQPHIAIVEGETAHLLAVSDLRKLASGQASISEFNDADLTVRILASALLERL